MVLSTIVSQTTLLNFSEDGNGQSTDDVTLSSREKLDTMRAHVDRLKLRFEVNALSSWPLTRRLAPRGPQ